MSKFQVYDAKGVFEFLSQGNDENYNSTDECKVSRDFIGVVFETKNLSNRWHIYPLMVASILFDGIAFYYIYKFKGLQAHPMKLFMWMSFFTFSYFWLLCFGTIFCDLRLEKFFNATVKF